MKLLEVLVKILLKRIILYLYEEIEEKSKKEILKIIEESELEQ